MAETIELGIVGISNKGEYDAQTSYEKLNVVTYEGSSYCAKRNCKGILPTDTEYWQLYAEKGDIGPQGPAPVKGVDYFTAQDKTEIENDLSSYIGTEVSEQLDDLVSATPLVASSVENMSDTTRIYVNTTDGNWYWYNGTNWTIGGVYQATVDEGITVEAYNFGESLKTKLSIETVEINHEYNAIGGFTVNSTTNKIVDNSNSNRAKNPRKRIYMGDVVKFNDLNGQYKISIALADENHNVYEYLKLSEYNSSLYPYVIQNENAKYLHVQFAKANDGVIDDVSVFDDLLTIERPQVSNNSGATIKQNTLALSQINDFNFETNNICSSDVYKYSYNNTNRQLSQNNTARCRIVKTYENIHYYIKIFGAHDRFRLIGLYDYLDFEGASNIVINSNRGGVIVSDDSLDAYDFVCPKKYKYLLIIYSNTSQAPNVMVSKTPIDGYEEYKVSISGLDFPFLDGQKYSLPNSFSDTLVYQASTYQDSHEMQGICTDGTYLYYTMHGRTDNDNSVIGKIRLSDNTLMLEKADYSYKHANGMCYDPINNHILVVGMDDNDTIFRVDPETLEYISSFSIKNTISTYWNSYSYGVYRGIGGIAYSTELEKFIVLIRKNDENDFFGFAILNKNFKLEKLLKEPTMVGTRGDIEADGNFIYLCYPDNTNKVVVYDYNGNLIDIIVMNDGSLNGLVKISSSLYYMSLSWLDRIYKCDVTSFKEISKIDTLTTFNYN